LTIIDKFEQHAASAEFAIALLTPDDVGTLQGDEKDWKPRARQNVIFELGWFLGRLGRGRVCALKKGDVEKPSDYQGVLYIAMDSDAWRTRLVKELKSAGFDVDANLAL
ncbi:MAG: nucleotide-binding protein, partial [Gammaproteobacteria bacterium]|nr:nucleotide-binding protein [Gammaproteobacteria bacterium]